MIMCRFRWDCHMRSKMIILELKNSTLVWFTIVWSFQNGIGLYQLYFTENSWKINLFKIFSKPWFSNSLHFMLTFMFHKRNLIPFRAGAYLGNAYVPPEHRNTKFGWNLAGLSTFSLTPFILTPFIWIILELFPLNITACTLSWIFQFLK